MRVLVFGGTVMVGHAVAAEAVARGHEVVCAARGSNPVPAGAKLVRIDRDAPDALAPLAGERFDAVIDLATMSYPWVSAALAALADRTRHWTFVSTINVYADTATWGQRPGAPLLEPLAEGGGEQSPEHYGAIKVASENAVLAAVGDRAFVVRPGVITGPGDVSDRFGYWPGRMARGGRVVVPGELDQPIQYIDVRDLAAWIVTAGEHRLTGVYDGVGPITTLSTLLADIAAAVRATEGAEVELVPLTGASLIEAGVAPWSGPKSLPLWAPRSHWGVTSHDPAPSLAAGLAPRPLPDAVAVALARERELGLDRADRGAGLTAEQETALLPA